jgi:hypothetical protein
MFCVLAAPLEGALDAGRALATLAKERSQGFIDAEPYNTRTWNGMWVIPHLHVDGRGGPQDLRGAWSEPLNAKTNTLCTPNATSPALRCPDRCAATHRVARRRVRRAIHALSDREWQSRSGSFSQGASNGAATSSHVVAAAPSANARTSAADSDDSFNAGAAPGPSGKWSSGPK